jgi:hypothetical protein
MVLCLDMHDLVHSEEAKLKKQYGLGPNDLMSSKRKEINIMRQAMQVLVDKKIIIQAQLIEFSKSVKNFTKSDGVW